jgi:hypothetical protein
MYAMLNVDCEFVGSDGSPLLPEKIHGEQTQEEEKRYRIQTRAREGPRK